VYHQREHCKPNTRHNNTGVPPGRTCSLTRRTRRECGWHRVVASYALLHGGGGALLARWVGFARTVYIHRTWPYSVVSLLKVPYIHRIYMVLANPNDESSSVFNFQAVQNIAYTQNMITKITNITNMIPKMIPNIYTNYDCMYGDFSCWLCREHAIFTHIYLHTYQCCAPDAWRRQW